MNPEVMWLENDAKIDNLRLKMVSLKKEFDMRNKSKELKNYDDALERFINRKLKKESNEIFKEQLEIIAVSLKT